MASTSTVRASGTAPGQRKLNGPQTTGREYRSLSEPEYGMRRDDDVPVPMRDGVRLLADVHRPDSDGRFPALIAASPYPRQIQDLGAPMGFIEAGASDFFVPRGYVHVIANLRGTGGSDGTFGCFDGQERQDMYDLVGWVAEQPWCDGNVGMIGISYFAMTQLEAAVEHPPALTTSWPPPGARHRELALRADGGLSDDEGTPGQRSYRCLGTGLNHVPADPAAEPPSQLTWTSAPLDTDIDMVGDIELRLTATATAADTAWIAMLQDVDTTGDVSDVTAGWLRASVREVDEAASRPGAPVLHCRTAVAVRPHEPVNYRIRLVPNARRFGSGHCIRLVLTSDDQPKDASAIMEFRHAPVGTSTTNTVSSASRLLLPVLEEPDGGLDA